MSEDQATVNSSRLTRRIPAFKCEARVRLCTWRTIGCGESHSSLCFSVRLTRAAGQSLGISIMGGRGMGRRLSSGEMMRGVFIKHISPDSPAAHNGTLRAGDRILEVQMCVCVCVCTCRFLGLCSIRGGNVCMKKKRWDHGSLLHKHVINLCFSRAAAIW